MKNPLIIPLSAKPKKNANIKNNINEGQEQRHETKSNQNSNRERRQRREKTQKTINGEWPPETRKTPLSKSIFTSKSTKILPTPIPHSASIYGRRIYRVTKKERCKGKKAEANKRGDDKTPADGK